MAKNLREIGEDGLRRELYKAINDAVHPALDEVRKGLVDHMPDRYAAVLDPSLKFDISKRTAGEDPGVYVIARALGNRRHPRKLPRLESGVLGHPVFGMKTGRRWTVWISQVEGVQPGFFSDPIERAAPQVRDKILEAVKRITAKANGR